ncbi:6-phosphogluconate dehydrogenase C-terminal domain-like protein [Apiospora rasikravindrae]|uniref:6-phosphogluconate dehydrogenase C-terminal domain-like protein n=1 Tax=Apiospora rasikravindrae TaxID=990691 RepID=A0ABR1RMZ4_9PEZI
MPIQGLSSRHEAFNLDPPLYYAPSLKQTSPFDVPFYRAPPAATSARPTPTTQVPITTDMGSATYQKAVESLRLSDQVHVLGFNREARYLMHCLSNAPGVPPPQLLLQHPDPITAWGHEGRTLIMQNADGSVTKTEIQKPHYVGHRRTAATVGLAKIGPIRNLVITDTTALRACLARNALLINHETTICLIGEGLGVMEHLNETIFKDPNTRPIYVLGTMSQKLSRYTAEPNTSFSVTLRRPGRLCLTGIPREHLVEDDDTPTDISHWPAVVARTRTQHLAKLLSGAPDLNVSPMALDNFLRQKLPGMVFSTATNSISAALGLTYAGILSSSSARRLWHELLDELVHIVASMPELQQSPEVIAYFTGRNFRQRAFNLLGRHDGISPWVRLLRDGHRVPMTVFNGYFARIAEKTGARKEVLETVGAIVVARQQTRNEEIQLDIPMYRSPYMMDSDKVTAEGEPGQPIRLVYINKKPGSEP